MNRILAIAKLTWKAAFRYRLFWVMAVLLVAAVVGLPIVLRDDGTAKGLTQILLAYTLSAVASLLGIATLWLSCGTLAKDIEECQMQVVATKPVGRWQVWLGKWLGIISLNAVLLTMAGASIFFLLKWRASHLPPDEQRVLQNEIFVARASIKDRPPDLSADIEKLLQEKIKKTHATEAEIPELRQQAAEEIKAALTEVEPGGRRFWVVDMRRLPESTRDGSFRLRVKFHSSSANTETTYNTWWFVGPPSSSGKVIGINQVLPADSYQEFEIPAGHLDEKNRLIIDFLNADNAALTFPIEDGFELLYYENTFGVNFVRGMMIILCWLALLAAIGLAAASQLSFPVAAFTSLAILIMGLCSGTIQTVVEQGTVTGWNATASTYGHSPVDYVIVPLFRGALKLIQMVESFSPIDFLSSGRSITWPMVGMAVGQIVLLLGGFFCVAGIILFTRRELATAQGNS